MAINGAKKMCFIITPIGPENRTEHRHISGVVHIGIKPVLERLGYEVKVEFEENNSNYIKREIMKAIYEADIIIADLTYQQPNIMYEISLRHAISKPIIHISKQIEKMPVKVDGYHIISYSDTMDGILPLQENLERAVKAIERNPGVISNPAAEALQIVSKEDSPYKAVDSAAVIPDISKILDELENINKGIDKFLAYTKQAYSNDKGSNLSSLLFPEGQSS